MRGTGWRFASGIVLATLALLAACRPREQAPEGIAYEISDSPKQLILLLRASGGLGGLLPLYRLYGDGRLVREIVTRTGLETVRSDEMRLARDEVERLFARLVASKALGVEPDGLLELEGGPPLADAFDAPRWFLRLHFRRYELPDGSERAPYTPRIRLYEPATARERSFPRIAEIDRLASLPGLLDAYFEESAREAMLEPAGADGE